MIRKNRKPTTSFGPSFSAHGYDQCRWVEYPDDSLRRVGYAEEILPRLGHQGWFINEFESDVFRGIVYQLPADRDGACRFVPGYQDPWNDASFLAFGDMTDDKRDAALAADRMAETFAEHEREYQAAAHAAFQVTELRSEADDLSERIATLEDVLARTSPDSRAHRHLSACLDGAESQLAELVRQESDLVDQFGAHPGFRDNI